MNAQRRRLESSEDPFHSICHVTHSAGAGHTDTRRLHDKGGDLTPQQGKGCKLGNREEHDDDGCCKVGCPDYEQCNSGVLMSKNNASMQSRVVLYRDLASHRRARICARRLRETSLIRSTSSPSDVSKVQEVSNLNLRSASTTMNLLVDTLTVQHTKTS